MDTATPGIEAEQTASTAIPRVPRAWYIACQTKELKRKPLPRVILGTALVLFRDENGTACTLLDQCPHRNIPLSRGRVCGAHIQCAYHGWEFDGQGHCQAVPGLLAESDSQARRVASFPTVEQEGFVWVYATAGEMPQSRPFSFTKADKPGYVTVRHEVRARASVHALAENALDVPHTAFLHGGLFRSPTARNPIKAVVERHADRCQAEYIGEPRPSGLAGRILAPSGGIVTHFDRFYLPSIVEVEYRIADDIHIVSYGACTPVDDFDTRMFGVVTVRTRLPGWLLRPIMQPLALRIFGQDREILELQTDQLNRNGTTRYVSTDLDLLGPHILRLLRRAAKGAVGSEEGEVYRKEVEMVV